MRQINLYNKLFYEYCGDAFTNSGLANFFVSVEPIQIALKEKVEKRFNKRKISLLELASGANPKRWETISSEPTNKKWDITLSDFSENALPDVSELESSNYKFRNRTLNLLKPFRSLSQHARFDVVLTTYAFDSIWFDKDVHIEKAGRTWKIADYKLKIDKGIANDKLVRFLNDNICDDLKLQDFKQIKIVKELEDFDINNFRYGGEILNRYSGSKNIKINYPGGLIGKVDEAFKKIIAKDGMFIIGDIVINEKKGCIKSDNKNYPDIYMDDYRTVGKVAKCKVEDYGLAKTILKKKGYKVELENIMDYVEKAGQITPINVTDHFIMTISRI